MFMKLYNDCEDCEEFVKRDLFRTILKMVKPGKIINGETWKNNPNNNGRLLKNR